MAYHSPFKPEDRPFLRNVGYRSCQECGEMIARCYDVRWRRITPDRYFWRHTRRNDDHQPVPKTRGRRSR